MASSADKSGFSLLELLVVVSILAAISLIATGAYRGILADSEERLVRIEMQEIAKALRQFKEDTGYYPKQGPFDLSLTSADSGSVTKECLPTYIGAAGLTDAGIRRWFNSPANFYQLLSRTSPLDDNDSSTDPHQLETWKAETGRGWRGPYLADFTDGYVDIGSEINESSSETEGVAGDPLEISDVSGIPAIPDVIGIADPFYFKAEKVSANEVDDTLLDWSRNRRRLSSEDPDDIADRVDIEKWGRPYLFFMQDEEDKESFLLVSMGPDGDFDNGVFDPDPDQDKDDIVLELE